MWTDLIAPAGAAVLGLVGGAAGMRRRLSRDSVEVARDRAESAFARLAAEAVTHRNSDLQAVARLEEANAHLAAEVERLHLEHAAFRRLVIRLYPEFAEFVASDVADLAEQPRTFEHQR